MHVLHKVFAEGDEEQDAQCAAQQRGQEHLHEVDGEFGILVLQNVEGGQGEDGTGHNHAGAGADALNNHVLAERVLAVGGTAQPHGNDGDGNGCFEHLAYFESEVGCGSGKDNGHEDTPDDGPRGHLAIVLVRFHQGFVLFAFTEFAKGVFGEGSFFHC